MNKVLIIATIFSIAIIYAQGNSGKNKMSGKSENVKLKKTIKGAMDEEMVPYSDEEPPGHAYGRNKNGLTGKEFGQQRAAEAKAKHKVPENQNDAITLISVIREETKETLDNVQDRIAEAEHRLGALFENGEMSEKDYNLKSAMLGVFVDRANTLLKKL